MARPLPKPDYPGMRGCIREPGRNDLRGGIGQGLSAGTRAYLAAACADDAELRRQILRKEMEQLTAQAAR